MKDFLFYLQGKNENSKARLSERLPEWSSVYQSG